MEVCDRIKYLRKTLLNLTQEEFGSKLGISRSMAVNIETADRLKNPEQKKPIYTLICKTFDVSEDWLLNGSGDPFVEKSVDEELMAWIGRMQFKADSGDELAQKQKQMFTALSHIKSDEAWWELFRFLDEVSGKK